VTASYHSLFFADVALLMPLCARRPRRSFAGEALERERFGQYVTASYHSGLGFARAKANLESINRWKSKCRRLEKLIHGPVKALQQQDLEMYGRRLARTQELGQRAALGSGLLDSAAAAPLYQARMNMCAVLGN